MLRWFNRTQLGESPQDVFQPLAIHGRGICSSLGHNARSVTAALNARMTHFQESRFIGQGGRAVRAGLLYGVEAWGMERLELMLDAVVIEALGTSTGPLNTIGLIVCSPESDRVGIDPSTYRSHIDRYARERGFHSESAVLPSGRGGIAQALRVASTLLYRTPPHVRPKQVLLVGLDSWLVAGSIEVLLAQDRLLTHTQADGLVPAEAAAALLLAPVTQSQASCLLVQSAAWAQDDWRHEGDEPMRATGLTQAVRSALGAAALGMSDVDFQISGFNGESWYAREVSLMQSRCMTRKRSRFAHLTPAQFVGDAPAATPVLALAWLADIMMRSPVDAAHPGRSALAHFSGDDGQRSAMVLRGAPAAPQLTT